MANRVRSHLGELSDSKGDYEGARQLYRQSLIDARRFGHRYGESHALLNLGWISLRLNDPEAAMQYLGEVLELDRGLAVSTTVETLGIGYALLAMGKTHQAFAMFCEALESARRTEHDSDIAETLVALAYVRNTLNERQQAAQLLGASEAVRERAGVKMHWSHRLDWERCTEAVRRELSKAVFEAAWAEGKRMQTSEAIAFGIRELHGIAGTSGGAGGLKTTLQEAKAQYGGLTTREREVAACVARGISNREIGDELVLSERTVEAHIGNILGKLQLASRTQIARWAMEKGLVMPRAGRTRQ